MKKTLMIMEKNMKKTTNTKTVVERLGQKRGNSGNINTWRTLL